MAYSNEMTRLVNKIEQRLGTRPLNLPENLKKDKWPEKVILPNSLITFSRYFPNKIPYTFTQDDRKNNYYIIDEAKVNNLQILGVKDINWNNFTPNSSGLYNQPYGIYDQFYDDSLDMDQYALAQGMANQLSLFNNGLFLNFIPPNKVEIKNSANADILRYLPQFSIEIFTVHYDNLMSIMPTKMELFERLAQADVAAFLYGELKFYDDLDTVFGNIQIKTDEIQMEATKRDEIMQLLDEGHVSAANENQPIMLTI